MSKAMRTFVALAATVSVLSACSDSGSESSSKSSAAPVATTTAAASSAAPEAASAPALDAASASAPTSPAAATSAPSTEKVTITYWGTYGNGGNKAQTGVLTSTIIPAFNKAHPNITVKYVDVPYDAMLQKLTTSAAGGTLPDLVRADIAWVSQLAELGIIEPLDEKMPDFQTLADATYPGTLATNKWGDHYYGLPLDTNTRVMFSNPEAIKASGLSAPPATFDELKQMAGKLGPDVSTFADSGLGGWNVLPWIWSAGGEITNPELTKSTGFLDSPASVAGVQMLADLYKAKAIPTIITGNAGGVATSDGLPKGKYATILDGPWMYEIWKGQYAKFAPTATPVPAGPGGSISVVGGEDIVMTTASKNHAAAMEFMRFTQTADYQVAMAQTGQMPVVKAIGDEVAKTIPTFAPFVEQLKTARPRPPVPAAAKIDGVLNNYVGEALKGSMPVQEALSAAAKEIDVLLALKK